MSAKESTAPKSNRVTNVQVPGASAPASTSSEVEKAEAATDKATDAATDGQAVASVEGVTTTAPGLTAEEADALRAENEELRAQIAAAGRAPAAGRELKPVQNRADYLTMRAVDVDPETLTKAVLTKDGWVCPPAIAKAQPK